MSLPDVLTLVFLGIATVFATLTVYELILWHIQMRRAERAPRTDTRVSPGRWAGDGD